jgi:hypothetical protein
MRFRQKRRRVRRRPRRSSAAVCGSRRSGYPASGCACVLALAPINLTKFDRLAKP